MNCFICKYTFKSVNHLLLHLKHCHKNDENFIYKCAPDKCVRQFNSLNSYRKHLTNCHFIKKVNFDQTEVSIFQLVFFCNKYFVLCTE